jgi:hypothetical protein
VVIDQEEEREGCLYPRVSYDTQLALLLLPHQVSPHHYASTNNECLQIIVPFDRQSSKLKKVPFLKLQHITFLPRFLQMPSIHHPLVSSSHLYIYALFAAASLARSPYAFVA